MIPVGEYTFDEELIPPIRENGRFRFRVYRFPETAIVLGRGSDPETELRMDSVLADRVKILRRRGGGCSVMLDPGNVIVSAVKPARGIGDIRHHFNSITEWLIRGLEGAGVEGVRKRGISDLAVGDRKIGGSSLYRPKGFCYYSASLLVNPDIVLMERYLAHPPREPEYRAGRSHRDFVSSVSGIIGKVETAEFAARLAGVLEKLESPT